MTWALARLMFFLIEADMTASGLGRDRFYGITDPDTAKSSQGYLSLNLEVSLDLGCSLVVKRLPRMCEALDCISVGSPELKTKTKTKNPHNYTPPEVALIWQNNSLMVRTPWGLSLWERSAQCLHFTIWLPFELDLVLSSVMLRKVSTREDHMRRYQGQ
jgi:hypothetical protein